MPKTTVSLRGKNQANDPSSTVERKIFDANSLPQEENFFLDATTPFIPSHIHTFPLLSQNSKNHSSRKLVSTYARGGRGEGWRGVHQKTLCRRRNNVIIIK
jgi:hypothetical protein